MKHILLLYNYWNDKCITGGQFYEDNMFRCMGNQSGIDIERFGINRKTSIWNKIVAPLLNLYYLNKCKKRDLIIFNSSAAWYFIPLTFLLRLTTKTKILIIHHHFLHMEFSGMKKFLYKNIENTFLKLADHIITVSPYIKDLCKEKYPNKSIKCWPIPFSTKTIHFDLKRKGELVYVGTIEQRKGLIYLIESLALLKNKGKNFHLNIIGKSKDEDYCNNLKKIILENDLNVNFHGFIPQEEKEQILKTSQLFVFPSLLEGYGMVLREAMAYGLPIVCFNNSAMPYLIKNGKNGLLVENKNSEKFASAISNIIENNEMRKSLSQGAYDTTTQAFTQEQYEKLIESEMSLL